jgi:hypothetical protein
VGSYILSDIPNSRWNFWEAEGDSSEGANSGVGFPGREIGAPGAPLSLET